MCISLFVVYSLDAIWRPTHNGCQNVDLNTECVLIYFFSLESESSKIVSSASGKVVKQYLGHFLLGPICFDLHSPHREVRSTLPIVLGNSDSITV